MIYVITILCYCVAFFFLWKDPNNAFYKFLFYSISAIPIWLFCQKYAQKKKVKLAKREVAVNILQVSIFIILGLSTMILTLVDFSKENQYFVNVLFILFIISTMMLIFWGHKISRKK